MKHTAIAPTLAAFVAAAFCTLAPLAAAGPKDDKIPVKPAPGVSDEDYRLGPGDKLRIEVYKDVQLSQSVQVRPDGKITLPLVGDVPAAGRTSVELRDAISGALKEYITNPVVTVIVTETTPQLVYITGEVNKPGSLTLVNGRMSILQALAMAGGFKEFANTKDVKVLRPRGGSNTIETIRFNYKDVVNGDAKPFYLRSGDTVIVP
jgi:polysaccharide biosynthesis/export protein